LNAVDDQSRHSGVTRKPILRSQTVDTAESIDQTNLPRFHDANGLATPSTPRPLRSDGRSRSGETALERLRQVPQLADSVQEKLWNKSESLNRTAPITERSAERGTQSMLRLRGQHALSFDSDQDGNSDSAWGATFDFQGSGIVDQSDASTENHFRLVSEHPISTFGVDVDKAGYDQLRDVVMRSNQLPPPESVQIEAMVNYFHYDYLPPTADAGHPVAAAATVAGCPWNRDHRLARITLKGQPAKHETASSPGDQVQGSAVVIAKDVNVQVRFEAAEVFAYRLIGYENVDGSGQPPEVTLSAPDDPLTVGEFVAGQAVTAFYEMVPAARVERVASKVAPTGRDDPLPAEAVKGRDTLAVILGYSSPDTVLRRSDNPRRVEIVIKDQGDSFQNAEPEFRFAAAVAGFGMKLRRSQYAGTWTLSDVIRVADSASHKDSHPERLQFIELVRKASQLLGEP
jgi:hypothetical protein